MTTTPIGHPSLPFIDFSDGPEDSFVPVVETSTRQALPAVSSGHAQRVYRPGEMAISYRLMRQHLDSLDLALAALPAEE